MFCTKCGNELENNAVFCSNCRAKVDGNDSVSETISKNSSVNGFAILINGNKKTVGVIAAIIAVVIIVAMAFHKHANTINLNDYLVTTVEGYDGYGYADVSIDWDAIANDYSDKLREITRESGDSFIYGTDVLQRYIYIEMEDYLNLSNGDKYIYKVCVDPFLENVTDLHFKYKDGSGKATDLVELEKFDVFEGLDISYVGMSPYMLLFWSYSGDYYELSDFVCDKPDNLADGDTLTVTFCGDIDTIAKSYGVVPEATEKTYEVKSEPSSRVNLSITNAVNAVVEYISTHDSDYYPEPCESCTFGLLRDGKYGFIIRNTRYCYQVIADENSAEVKRSFVNGSIFDSITDEYSHELNPEMINDLYNRAL